MKTYGFAGVSFAFFHPLTGPYVFTGKQGNGAFSIAMAGEKSTHDVAADGGVMVSMVMGDNGALTVEAQQTSDFHAFLVQWYNLIKTAAELGDLTDWATASISIKSLVDGAWHSLTGVSPAKLADKGYAAQGQKVSWTLLAADVQTGQAG